MKPIVVVGYDQTPSSERALTEAGREAAWRGAAVSVVHTFRWIPAATPAAYVPMRVELDLRQSAEATADAGVHALRESYPGMTVEPKAISGPAADALAEASRDADLLLLGNRGRGGFAGLLLGSVSMRTLGFASCPTMIVRGPERPPLDEVVLALDLEDPADEVLDFAFAEASLRGARLHAINVWHLDWIGATAYPATAGSRDDPNDLDTAKAHAAADIHTALETVLRPWQAKYPNVRLHIEVADGTPSAVLVAATGHADVIVAGAHHRGDGHLGMRLGPVAHALLHHSECPVVVVPRS
jgi:nucleotide-binding universal stress UspA family protein